MCIFIEAKKTKINVAFETYETTSLFIQLKCKKNVDLLVVKIYEY